MFALRYLALAALALWIGGMLVLLLAGEVPPDLLRLLHWIAVTCGAVILAALVSMKFIGPPPLAFPLRAAVVAAMLGIALWSARPGTRALSTPLTSVNALGGLFLLSFYARE